MEYLIFPQRTEREVKAQWAERRQDDKETKFVPLSWPEMNYLAIRVYETMLYLTSNQNR